MTKFNCYLLLITCSLLTVSCSSAPPRSADVYSNRNLAIRQLDLANHNASRGQYDAAMVFLEEARRLALSTDDPSLRVRTSISRGSILFASGRQAEAFREWEAARLEATASGEPLLAALARINAIRASVILLDDEPDANAVAAAAAEYRNQLNREINIVRSDPSASAAAYLALGLAEKQLGRFADAESAVRRSADLYERNLSLENAAYGWYIIASIRSVAGNYEQALEALRRSINLDRRTENGYGLAASWQAMGDVYQRAGQTEESQAAYRRAAEISRAIGR
ncbi:MAG: tetratricopeptide repeat protein [Treponema sp.]|nr:tetratricopeptide repeat protein [Treponema sp.]